MGSTGRVPDSGKDAVDRETAAANRRSGGSGGGPGAGMGPGVIVAWQSQAGNRAVSGMLSSPPQPVQRLLKTKASDLGSLGDTVKRLAGIKADTKTPEAKLFGEIRQLLTDYRKQAETGTSKASLQSRQLEHIDDLCAKYVTTFGRSYKSRAKILSHLQDEIVTERATLSKGEAMDVYQESVKTAGTGGSGGAQGADTAERSGFKGLSAQGQMGATNHALVIKKHGYEGPGRDERIKVLKQKYGLTDAEVSAITIYSAGDFSYINPVTANSASWLSYTQDKQRSGNSPQSWASLDDRTVKEEGGLHAGMAVKGLEKMKPYKGATYRGARYTPEDFEKEFAKGKKTTFGALGSSSKDQDIALKFAYFLASGTTADPKKTVGVLSTVVNGGGRDVSGLALVQEEAEVLILPGTTFEVVSVEKLKDPESKYPEIVAQAKKDGKPLPTEFYLARLKRVETPSTATAPKTKPLDVTPKRKSPWQGATPAAAGNPFAVPSNVGILGQDRSRPDRATDLNEADLQRALEKMEKAGGESDDALAALKGDE